MAYTRPSRTAFNDAQTGCCCKIGTSSIVRSRVKPQGERTRTSGSAVCNSCQLSHGECCPTSPKTFSPPAYSTNSGVQLPEAINGSSHSNIETRGLLPDLDVALFSSPNLFL